MGLLRAVSARLRGTGSGTGSWRRQATERQQHTVRAASHAPGAGVYGRVLRLRRTVLPWWLRAVYVEGAVLVGFVLYLADAASAWVILVLPLAVAASVKLYDAVLVRQKL